MFADLDKDLHFGYQRNGSLVLAMSQEEKDHLQVLYERGVTNGVKNLRLAFLERQVLLPNILQQLFLASSLRYQLV